jgi:ABC-type multidrug transport system permease subunit
MSDMENRNYSQLWVLVKTRLIEFTRQPEAVFWVYFFPILMVVVLGIAFRSQRVETFRIDVAQGPGSELLASRLETNEQIELGQFSEEECRTRLRTGKTSLVVVAKKSDGTEVDYLFDPSRPGSLNGKAVVDQQLQAAAGRVDAVKANEVKFEEPGGRYIDFLVPGLLGMSLMGGGLWGVGFAVVDMRIKKLLKRFVATPMKKSHFLCGVIGSRLVYMVPQILLLIVFAWLVFGVKIFGSWLALIVVVLIGALEFCGIGILIASRAKTIESVSGLMNLVMLPLYTLSGIFFSYEQFPEAVHPYIKWLPLTPVIDALRAIWLDGASLASQWYELMIMSIWCALSFTIALLLFRWSD